MAKRLGVFVGCSDYEHFERLPHANGDAEQVAELFRDQEVGGFSEGKTLNAKESPEDVYLEVDSILKRATSKDSFLFYFSGHGMVDGAGDLHLALNATNRTDPRGTTLPFAALVALFHESACSSYLSIVDSCSSAAADSALLNEAMSAKLRARFNDAAGISLIASSEWDMPSYSFPDAQHSLFSGLLIQGLQYGHADLNQDGAITATELYQYLQALLRASGLQSARRFFLGGTDEFLVARNRHFVPMTAVPQMIQPVHSACQTMLARVSPLCQCG
jgi:hypothetical protein